MAIPRLLAVHAASCLALAALAASAAADVCALGSSTASGVCRDALGELGAGVVAVELLQVQAGKRISTSANAMQMSTVEASKESQQKAFEEAEATGEQIPGLGNVVDAIPGLGGITGALTNAAAEQLVSRLNSTMSTINEQADQLVTRCINLRDRVLQRISEADATAQARAEALEEEVNQTVGEFVNDWSRVTGMFNNTVEVVISVLDAAGQQEMALTVQDALSVAIANANAVRESLDDAPEAVAGIHAMVDSMIAERLAQLNSTLESSLSEADSFVQSLDEAFGGMLDTAANALANAVPGTDAAQLRSTFDPLQTEEAGIGQNLVNSLRTLVSGLGVAQASTQEVLSVDQSTGTRASSLLALGIAVAVTGLAKL